MKSSILLLSCYELGHQPLSLAWPLAALRQAGYDAATADLAVEEFPTTDAAHAGLVAIAVPMHTALRIGTDAARRVRAANPSAHICFFGLYAWLNRDYLLQSERGENGLADSVAAGEVETVVVDLAQALAAGNSPSTVAELTTRELAASPNLKRISLPLPDRSTLPSLDSYAHYQAGPDAAHLAGYVEASRGCLHTCRHCPVVPVYKGRFFVVPVETVLADIAQQVKMGARHITFGDPDFLNGPGHARNVARALHGSFPQLTFDFTAKVEHILERHQLIPELVRCGASFVVSAFESTSDRVLDRLQKGHTRQQMEEALAILRQADLSIQPTWMPFTPWTSLEDYLVMLDWIRRQGLIPHVPAVQLSIRMLVPPHSSLLNGAGADAWAPSPDPANFSYRWLHPDPKMDALQQQVARIAETASRKQTDGSPVGAGSDPACEEGSNDSFATFRQVEEAAYKCAGRPAPAWPLPSAYLPQPPRLTEHWFC